MSWVDFIHLYRLSTCQSAHCITPFPCCSWYTKVPSRNARVIRGYRPPGSFARMQQDRKAIPSETRIHYTPSLLVGARLVAWMMDT
jgi:hypothetical protein